MGCSTWGHKESGTTELLTLTYLLIHQGIPIHESEKVAQSCPALCNPMDCGLSGSSVAWDSPGKKTGSRCHALLQGIFMTQGPKLGLCIVGIFFTI